MDDGDVNGSQRVFNRVSPDAGERGITSVSGMGDRYPDPKSVVPAGRDNYVLLTFRRESNEMIVDVKALDGGLLDRTRYSPKRGNNNAGKTE